MVEIRLDLVEGVRDGSAASQFFKSELFIFCPLSRTWSLDLIPPIFNNIPSANHLVNQSKININMFPLSTSVYICLGWESRPNGVHVLLAVTRWWSTLSLPSHLVTFVTFHLATFVTFHLVTFVTFHLVTFVIP